MVDINLTDFCNLPNRQIKILFLTATDCIIRVTLASTVFLWCQLRISEARGLMVQSSGVRMSGDSVVYQDQKKIFWGFVLLAPMFPSPVYGKVQK